MRWPLITFFSVYVKEVAMLCYTLDKAFLTNSYKMFYINVLYFIKPEKNF